MKNQDSRDVEEARILVESIRDNLIYLAARTRHSAEMALIHKALTDIERLRSRLRSSPRGSWDWQTFASLLAPVANVLVKLKWR
jgi:hypothetical protein